MKMDAFREVRFLFFLLLCIAPCFAIDMVRIVDSNGKESNSTKGTVEFLFNGHWGGICFNDFMKEDGGVICRHLNFAGINEFFFQHWNETQHRHDVEISCYGHEENLHSCYHSPIVENDAYICKKSPLFISCYNHSEFSVADSTVRLDGGDGSYGRVEFGPDKWNTVCGESWGELEGGVVCRELGFRGVKSLNLSPWPISKKASSSKFKCNGYEMSLAECQINEGINDAYSYFPSFQSLDETSSFCSELVEVMCLHDIDFISPKSKQTYEKPAGNNFTLKCNATNSTNVWWRHQNWKEDKIVANATEFKLPSISPEHQGSYTCIAKGLRGQFLESDASQTLIISDYTQMLLETTSQVSYDYNMTVIRNKCISRFHSSEYEVNIKNGEGSNFTMQLGKSHTAGINLTTINDEVDKILEIIRKEIPNSERLPLLKRGLSFCIGEQHETHSAGILHFPCTNINSSAESIELCVGNKIPRASRKCSGDLVSAAVWEDVDLRNCFNTTEIPTKSTKELVKQFFEEVEEANVTSENVSFVSRDLADATAIEGVTREAINDVKTVLQKITNVESASPSVTRNVIETVDNVVDQSSGSDEILSPEASSTILKSFERQLDTVKQSGSNFTHKGPNIEVNIIQVKDKKSPIKYEFFQNETHSETKLNRNKTDIQQEGDLQAAVEIPADVLQNLSENCSVTENSSNSSLPISFTIFLNDALFDDSTNAKERNSLIVSTSMLCDVSSLPNGTYISTVFTPTQNDTGEHPWECVFWKPSTEGHENETGVWSSEGCVDCGDQPSRTDVETCPTSLDTRVRDPVELYKCSWTHLTNFAVLLDVKGDIGSKVLDVITIIGCVISIIALLVTISSYLFMKKLRSSQPKQIIIMLCSSLLGLYFSFMIGIDRTESPAVCVTFGGLIHFFCLSTVAWMSIEATQLYLLLVKVVNAHVRHFMMKASTIAWGIPFVVVVVCVAAARDAYAHKYCFPAHCSYVFYIGVLGLVALLLVFNIVTYTMIVRSITATRKNISTSQSNRAGMIRRLQNALAISVLLGLSWVFGFLAIGSVRMMFNVLFCLFNSFQGFFIFLLFCLRQDEIREAWREWFGIAICLKTEDDTTTVSEKPSTSTTKHLTRESEVSKSFFKPSEKSDKVELTAFKSIEEATAATPE